MDGRQHHAITIGQKMIAACSGSLFTSVAVTPFDVVRVRLQQQSASASSVTVAIPKVHPVAAIPQNVGVSACCRDVFWFPSTIDYCVASDAVSGCAVDARKFTGTWDGLKKIAQFEGPTTLWRGLSLTLLMAIPSNVVYFIAYEYMRDNSPIKSELLNPLLCGSLARSLSSSVVSPLELIKTRIQSIGESNDAVASVMKGVREMVRDQGVSSLWRGLLLTLWRDVPFSGIYWASVEYFRKQMRASEAFQKRFGDSAFEESFIAGSLGGAIAAVLTTPFDVGKTRRQLCHHSATSTNMRMIPFMYHIFKTEGVSALYVGVIPRILRVAPACAIMISSYEVSKKLFHEQNHKERLNQI